MHCGNLVLWVNSLMVPSIFFSLVRSMEAEVGTVGVG